MNRIARAGAGLLLAAAVTAAPAAVEENGASFEEAIRLDGNSLDLAGTGVAKYRVVFTVYAAALYVPEGTPRDEVLDEDTPRRLEIEYFYEIPPEDIIRAANTVLERQLGEDGMAAIEDRLSRFQDWFEAVEDGDRYRMDYVPGEGTTLSFNGEEVGTVEGADFAEAYFGIWLSDNEPLSDGLREDLMAGLEE